MAFLQIYSRKVSHPLIATPQVAVTTFTLSEAPYPAAKLVMIFVDNTVAC